MTVGEQQVSDQELSDERRRNVQQALSDVVFAHERYESDLELTEMATRQLEEAQLMQQKTERARQLSEGELRQKTGEAYYQLTPVIHDKSVPLKDKLDVWYAYQERLAHGFDDESCDVRYGLLHDRYAVERIQPGVRIMHLYPGSGKPILDRAVAVPSLEVSENTTSLGLTVVMETESTRPLLPHQIRGVHGAKPGIRTNLENISKNVLVGIEDITEYFNRYQPIYLTAEDIRNDLHSRVYEARRAIQFYDALLDPELLAGNDEARLKIKTATIENGKTALGVGDDGALIGVPNKHTAKEFLKGMTTIAPEAFSELYDAVALGLYHESYRWPESYSNLFAEVQSDTLTAGRLGLEQKAEALIALKARGKVLSEERTRS